MSRKAMWMGAGATGAALALATVLRRKECDLASEVVLITGGSRGLGLALAKEFAARGCRVAICARDRQELATAADRIGHDVAAYVCDVANQDEVDTLIEATISRFGKLDILVNNAGEIQVGPIQSMTVDDFRSAMDIMYWGCVYTSLALLPHLLERHSGRIVNITSIGAKVAVPHLIPYAAAKFAAYGFSQGLHAELAGTGVGVTTVAPGLMRTGSYLNAKFKGDVEREALWFSLGATLPATSIDAGVAARQIVKAVARGDADVTLSLPAKALALFHGVFPGATADILAWVNRTMLPAGSDQRTVRGHETAVLQRPAMKALTTLGRRAAQQLNEI